MNRPTPIVVFGAGGFGREVVTLIRDIQAAHPGAWDLLGLLDDAGADQALCDGLGIDYLGDRSVALSAGTKFVVAIGAGRPRQSVTDYLESRGMEAATLVHPSVWMGAPVTLGSGSVVCAGCILTTNISFGRGAQINLASTIGHDVRAGDFVTISPAVSLSGGVTVGDCATIYTHAAVNPMVSIGDDSVVGAGAVVTKDVMDGQTVVGVPARPLTPPGVETGTQHP